MSEENPLPTSARPGVQRARSLPYRRPFVVAVFLSAIHYLALVASCTALVVLVQRPAKLVIYVFFTGIAVTVASWVVAFIKRRSIRCPLCKGTPLVNTGAHTHSKAVRIFPFNHGVTAILSIIVTQKFRCMYCGSPYDLLKLPARLRTEPYDTLS